MPLAPPAVAPSADITETPGAVMSGLDPLSPERGPAELNAASLRNAGFRSGERARTRMVRPGCAVVGDFAMAARLLDGQRSSIRVDLPPPGTFATEGPAVCAEVYEGLAVHLPTHFFHVVPS